MKYNTDATHLQCVHKKHSIKLSLKCALKPSETLPNFNPSYAKWITWYCSTLHIVAICKFL